MTSTPIRIDRLTAPLAARDAAIRAAAAADRPTAGSYMRRCRHRARLSRRAVAEKICASPAAYLFTERALRDLETDQPGEYAPLIRSLQAHRAFAFDPSLFFSLAAQTAAPALDEFAAA